VPADVTAAALAAFDARTPDADVAVLVADSLDDPASDPADRQLRFAGSDRELIVSVVAPNDGLDGRVVVDLQPAEGALEVQTRGDAEVTAVPVLPGRWLISPACTGLVSFVVVVPGARRLCTEWTRI
jgi:hypothetical protein